MVFAGFWRRFGALMIDGVITFVISMILMMISANSVATGILINLLYFPFFESSALQGSPGKYLLGMRLTDMQGNRVTFKAAFIRFLVKIVSGMVLLLGYFMMLFTEKKQTLHDTVAGTLVLQSPMPEMNVFQAWYQQVLAVLGMVDKVPSASTGAAYTSSASSASTAAGSSATSSSTNTAQATPADLAGLYELYQKGILTETEYNEKRAELLKKL